MRAFTIKKIIEMFVIRLFAAITSAIVILLLKLEHEEACPTSMTQQQTSQAYGLIQGGSTATCAKTCPVGCAQPYETCSDNCCFNCYPQHACDANGQCASGGTCDSAGQCCIPPPPTTPPCTTTCSQDSECTFPRSCDQSGCCACPIYGAICTQNSDCGGDGYCTNGCCGICPTGTTACWSSNNCGHQDFPCSSCCSTNSIPTDSGRRKRSLSAPVDGLAILLTTSINYAMASQFENKTSPFEDLNYAVETIILRLLGLQSMTYSENADGNLEINMQIVIGQQGGSGQFCKLVTDAIEVALVKADRLLDAALIQCGENRPVVELPSKNENEKGK